MKQLIKDMELSITDLPELNPKNLITETREKAADDIGKRATNFARYAMADVEFALNVLGTGLSEVEYERVFKAMMVRKAKNELRKYNAN